ncbi:cache domain-containing protein [Legionella sp. 16cNR16C]|uniref:cache domain-containing protein n=1 Tax=Legionella sp. 16cNR16C TaxID=2905656 RepID=UPI001E3BFB58|nr:cache domain-containing protein [Legionella sp. 16cNR16C]MCE3045469.1 cache domain-containing protein [Legionella sp. 16cNR16C]
MSFSKWPYTFYFLLATLPAMNAFAMESLTIEEKKVINRVTKARILIETKGKKAALNAFQKNSSQIFAIELDGTVLASPIHPEMIGTNQWLYKDDLGVLVVQEEIAKAKAGGGWLNARFRKNHLTGRYACRKLYILPIQNDFFIGSWYYYPARLKNNCPV